MADLQGSNNPPAVLVDGYNILMAWIQQPGDKSRKQQIANDFAAARDMILKDLSDYSGWRRFRMMVAFDAYGNVDAPRISRWARTFVKLRLKDSLYSFKNKRILVLGDSKGIKNEFV